jgi:hypothetical protein
MQAAKNHAKAKRQDANAFRKFNFLMRLSKRKCLPNVKRERLSTNGKKVEVSTDRFSGRIRSVLSPLHAVLDEPMTILEFAF